MDNTPVLVVCYNNHAYVKNTLRQLDRVCPHNPVVVLDNSSTDEDTVRFLEGCGREVLRRDNHGPWVDTSRNTDLYHSMPEQYVLTDDLEFHEDLSSDFMTILKDLSEGFRAFKVGFALDISEPEKFFPSPRYAHGLSIFEWERRYFWDRRLPHDRYEFYEATIDTTFALYNKKYPGGGHIRVAGGFTAKHLPWYTDNPVYPPAENIRLAESQSHISTTSRVILEYYRERLTIDG